MKVRLQAPPVLSAAGGIRLGMISLKRFGRAQIPRSLQGGSGSSAPVNLKSTADVQGVPA